MIKLTREQIKNLREKAYQRGHADGRKEVMALYAKLIENHNRITALLTGLVASNKIPVAKLGHFNDLVPREGEDFSVRLMKQQT